MIPIVSLLVVIVVSLLIVRVATVSLTLTGLSHQLARFQARSAFTGAGFTTGESEQVVQHPVRRRIIMLLMLLGNAGIVTAVSSLILSFTGGGDSSSASAMWARIAVLGCGLTVLWCLAHSRVVDQWLSEAITWALRKWTDLEVRDYAGLLHLSGDYAVVELQVEPEDWMANQKLSALKLSDEGVLVLGIEAADRKYIGAPRGETCLSAGDTVLMYGPRAVLENLDERRAGSEGNWEHHKAVEQQLSAECQEQKRHTRQMEAASF